MIISRAAAKQAKIVPPCESDAFGSPVCSAMVSGGVHPIVTLEK